MEELIRNKKDLRLEKIEQVIEKSKDEAGKIRIDALNNEIAEKFGSSTGGEYFMDHTSVSERRIGIPVLQKNAEYLATSRAVIYAPKKGKNELLSEVKRISKDMGISSVVSVGGKAVTRIPVQKMYLEIAAELHNRLLDEFGDRVLLTAVVGGTGTRNVATIPIKVKADRYGQLRPLIGTFPDLDFFAVIKGIKEDERRRIQEIAHEIESKIAPKYGFSSNSYFVDVHRDYGIVDEKDYEGMAHSLHRLKPKIILHGKGFYENVQKNVVFQRHAEEEARRYAEKLGILSSAVYARTIANVWRQIANEIKDAEEQLKTANGEKKKEIAARKILAEELKNALQDVIEAYAPLGMDVKSVVEELERKNMDRTVKETAPKIYQYSEFGGKRMYLARKLANNDKETARILATIEAASNIALERARQRIKERNHMVSKPEERILGAHIFRAAKAVQRKVLATAIEDLIRAKIATGKSAMVDGYKYMPEKIYRYPGDKKMSR